MNEPVGTINDHSGEMVSNRLYISKLMRDRTDPDKLNQICIYLNIDISTYNIIRNVRTEIKYEKELSDEMYENTINYILKHFN